MKDQSHKDEMSAAIRGDFQRLRDRGVAATLAPRDEPPAPAAAAPDAAAVPPGPSAGREAPPEVALEEVAAELPGEPANDVGEPRSEAQPGFLARLLGR